jgi:TldD protein
MREDSMVALRHDFYCRVRAVRFAPALRLCYIDNSSKAPTNRMKQTFSVAVISSVLILSSLPLVAHSSSPTKDVLLDTMQRELHRATTSLAKSDPAPYYLSYSVADSDGTFIVAANGGIIVSVPLQRREADVMMRVGAEALDNTHGQSRPSGLTSGSLPLNDDADAIARVLWQLTDHEYEQASSAFLKVKTNKAVQSAEEDQSPDFSQDPPQTHLDESRTHVTFDQKVWESRIRKLSSQFLKYPDVYTSAVVLEVDSARSYLATSEGTALVQPSAMSRLIIQADARADDGMDMTRVESFQAASPDLLPSDAVLAAKVEKIAKDLKDLRAAPAAEPYAGPAMLSGRAAAVFFHEVLGHRLEGHRQRDESEGQTFTKKVNQKVLPAFLTVVDDPTMKELNGVKLAGSYDFDDEGDPAQRVDAVDNGVLKNFLMSRMPITGFSHSNGHGRRQAGLMPTGRQGNLIVTSTNTVRDSELRQKFIDEIKKQGKPYGLYFDDIQGGFTLTTRALPQAFQVLPVMVYRVYADGRPDELVRGVDIVGTPLLSLNNIMVTGDTEQVFNGICGAESGQVPVAAAAPAMLFSEIEVQKRRKGTERPPILSPPGSESAAPSAGAKPAPAAGKNQ